MKKIFYLLVVGISILLLGCQDSDKNELDDNNQDTLFQYSTLATLLQGVYDGNMSVEKLKEHGDFGLGTFNELDGEMLMIDNSVYKIASDGVAREMSDDIKIPFAAVTYFEADQEITLKNSLDCTDLKTYIDEQLPTTNIAYAIKIEGLFNYVKSRSVAKQTKPYATLAEVIKTQSTFEFSAQEGTLVGFRLPSYMDGANAAGYHLHFLTREKDAGGHLLECQTQDVKIEIDYIHKWETILPSDSEFYNAKITDESYQ